VTMIEPILHREPVEPTPRKAMTDARKRQALEAYGKACAACGASLLTKCEIDHRIQLWMGGPEDLANLQPLCVPCHAEKTAKDAGDRAKAKRRKAKHTLGEPRPQSNRPLKGRNSFDKTRTRKFNGKVVARG
jgi:5-methylcytosine-specific restriction endonuclease McrA